MDTWENNLNNFYNYEQRFARTSPLRGPCRPKAACRETTMNNASPWTRFLQIVLVKLFHFMTSFLAMAKTRASSVLRMAYRKRCIMLFTMQQDCNTRAKRVGSISWYPFSPWQNSSELGFAHGLPKALFIVVKVVQVVFHYKQECAPKAKRPCCVSRQQQAVMVSPGGWQGGRPRHSWSHPRR